MSVPAKASRVMKVCLTVVIISLLCAASHAQQLSAADRQQQLRSLFEEEWQYELKSQPERSTAIGDTRYNDKLDDESAGFYQSDVSEKKKFLSRFEAISADGLPHEDGLSLSLMIRHLREDIEGAQFKPWEMPVNQMNGIHLELADLVTLTPFNTVRDYDNYLARLHAVPRKFDQVTANMRQGMKDGLMPPKYLLEMVAAEAQQ